MDPERGRGLVLELEINFDGFRIRIILWIKD